MAKSTLQSRRLQDGPGDSREDTEYESDDGASIKSTYDFEMQPESGRDLEDEHFTREREDNEIATLVPTRATKASSKQSRDSPVEIPTNRLSPHGLSSSRVASRSEMQPESGRDLEDEHFTREREDNEIATLVPTGATKASSRQSRDSPVEIPTNRLGSHDPISSRVAPRSQTKSYPSTRVSSNAAELSFTLPSMHGTRSSLHNGSPLENSEIVHTKKEYRNQSRSGGVSSQQSASSPTVPQTQADQPVNIWYYVSLFWKRMLAPFLSFVGSVFVQAAEIAKPFLAFLLIAWLVGLLLAYAYATFYNTIRDAFSPACIIPGSSYIIPFCSSERPKPVVRFPNFDGLMETQLHFEDIMDSYMESTHFPDNIKSAEFAIRDVRTVVAYSNLPSKAALGAELGFLIKTANQACDQFIIFQIGTESALRGTVIKSQITMRALNELQEKQASISRLRRIVSALDRFPVIFARPRSLEEQVWEEYTEHIRGVKKDIVRLAKKGNKILGTLEKMNESFEKLHEIATRDNVRITADRHALLSELWSRLGGNLKQFSDYEGQLKVLNELSNYRLLARKHVLRVVVRLKEMAQELEALENGIAKLAATGLKAKMPLEHFVEVTAQTVERLEAKERESDALNRGMSVKSKFSGRKEELPLIYAKSSRGKK